MFILKIIGDVLGRKYDAITAISLAGLVLLVQNPFVVCNSGFQMSFGAIIAIVLILPIVEEILNTDNKIIKVLSANFTISLVMNPILAWNYYELPTFSFLLNIVGKILEEQGKEICYENMAFSQMGNKIWKHPSEFEEVVCLVDGLDEKYRYKQIAEHIKNGRGCYICTARENKFNIKFDYEIKLKPLTDNQILLFISDYLGTRISSENIVEDVIKGLDKQNLMPRMIAEKLHTKLKGEGLNEYFLDFEKDIHQLYTYKGGVSLQHPEIVVPERKIIRVPDELKNDIKVVTHSLVDKVALRPEILQEITPRQFEELVCELFERKGYNVQLTKQTRDGGKDLIVLNNSMLGDLVIYAECKKKAPKHPVNVGLVRQLYGTVEADRVTAGIMVTNSYFSEDARRFQQTIKSGMNLIDYSELMRQIMDSR